MKGKTRKGSRYSFRKPPHKGRRRMVVGLTSAFPARGRLPDRLKMLRPKGPSNGRSSTGVFAFPLGGQRSLGLKRDVCGDREAEMLAILSM
jgi:hypothetical protein